MRFLLVGILLFYGGISLAQENEEAVEDRNLARLDQVNDLLQDKKLTNNAKADLLFEKSTLMFETFGPVYLRTATESLIESIRLSPEPSRKDYLRQVYNHFWNKKDLSGGEPEAVDLRNLRSEIQSILNEK